MKISRFLRKYSKTVAVDLAIAVASVLSFIGVLSLLGADLSKGDILTDVAPLFLGALSVVIAFTILKISVDESRQQAKRDRDHQVRPVLSLRKADDMELILKYTPVQMYYPKPHDGEQVHINQSLEIENIGLGPAQAVEFIFNSADDDFLASGQIDTIRVGEKMILALTGAIPDGALYQILTVYQDIYGKTHVCIHHMLPGGQDGFDVISNSYKEIGEWFWNREIDKTLCSYPCDEENLPIKPK